MAPAGKNRQQRLGNSTMDVSQKQEKKEEGEEEHFIMERLICVRGKELQTVKKEGGREENIRGGMSGVVIVRNK
ncbi:hypothetical protein XELAEV_18004305mg [Xenopus laevis]|uniref:Uncharacterized protein n=1 Tax=Xenopus laevis TaxID=8355 RepID=A0A974GYE1_XENLA|nr:hypothetical protein XELAEV_18004305mg [Xenopus laevis]